MPALRFGDDPPSVTRSKPGTADATFSDSVDDLSDRELITAIHLTATANRSGFEFELQRRFVERLTKAMAGGTIAAWALVAGTFVLGVATILLVILAW